MEVPIKWNKENYNDFLKRLKGLEDTEYKTFHKKLLKNDSIKVIGIRTPILRKIAKQIKDEQGFLKYNTHTYYEENILAALVISKLKDNLFEYIDEFIPYIDNWAVNDIFAGSLKQFKNIDINYINKYLESTNPWSIRFGLTLLLSHYVNEENIDTVLKMSESVNNSDYYVEMANAWLLSICYIKFPKQTEDFFKKATLDDFTFNKTISKICDSYRVSKEDKLRLKELKKGRK